MGCSYRDLRHPWTSLSASQSPGAAHTQVHMFVNGAMVGTLTVRNEEFVDVVRSFSDKEIAKLSSLDKGLHLDIYEEPKSKTVVSEYGDLEYWPTLKRSHPLSPVNTLIKLVEWARKTLEVGYIGTYRDQVASAYHKGNKALADCKVDEMKERIDELKTLQEKI